MEWLNYHHLLYFWVVAREGTITAASKELRLAPSTISEQIRQLEDQLGLKLFKKSGRNIVLTDMGQAVYRYANEIFTLGQELMGFVGGRQGNRLHLHVGISMVVPKLVALRLLEPAMNIEPKIHLFCKEAGPDELMADLALHHIDLVLTDAPLGPDSRIRAFNHLLGECGVVIMAAPKLAAQYRENFPACLDGAPFLLPMTSSVLRRQLDRWFDSHNVQPEIVAEFDDSALKKVFGQRGMGLFASPSLIVEEVTRQYEVEAVGEVEGVTERFYAVSVQRQLKHPGIVAISKAARAEMKNQGRKA